MRQERRHFQPPGSKRIAEWFLARNHTRMQRYLRMIALLYSHSSIPQSQRKGTIRQHYRRISSMMANLLNKIKTQSPLSTLSSELYNLKGPSCRVSFRLPWKLLTERCSNSSLGRSIHHCPSHSSLAISTWDALQKESLPKKAVLREGKSIHHVIGALIPVKRKEGDSQKLPIRSIPSSITKEEREGRSMDHLSSSDSLSISREE